MMPMTLALTCLLSTPVELTPNAGGEPRPMAGATQEWRLLGVGSTAMLGGIALPFDGYNIFL